MLLTVKEQIEDSKYYLDLLYDKKERNDLRPLLSGFLAICRSIPDHLLEEYNIKFGLNISLTENLNIKNFKNEAKRQNSRSAISFIDFYKQEFDNLDNISIFKYIRDKRNIKIDRNDVHYNKEAYEAFHDHLAISATFNYTITDKFGNIRSQTNLQQSKFDNDEEKSKEPIRIMDNPIVILNGSLAIILT